MKIKSIEKKGEKLFLVTYQNFFGKLSKRFVIQTSDNVDGSLPFSFRCNSGTLNYVDSGTGETQLKWMVNNNVDSFDNGDI